MIILTQTPSRSKFTCDESLDVCVARAIDEGNFNFEAAAQSFLFVPLCTVDVDGQFIMRLTYYPPGEAERIFYWALDVLMGDQDHCLSRNGEEVLLRALQAGLGDKKNGSH